MSGFSNVPRHPAGRTPFRDFPDAQDVAGTKVGLITRVDELNMKADVKILTGGGHRMELDLTQAMAGPRSFWGGVPEVNSFVLLGQRRISKNLNDTVILGYLPTGNRSGLRFDPFTAVDPSEVDPADKKLYEQMVGAPVRYKRLLMGQGDVGGMSASGSEFVLSKDVAMTNRAGDMLELRDAERTLVAASIHRVQTESGIRHVAGPIRRAGLFLPEDIFQLDPYGDPSAQLKTQEEGYYGTDELQAIGPGVFGGPNKFASAEGEILGVFNDYTNFPPVTLSNGKRYYYPTTFAPNLDLEDPNQSGDAFVEHRMELFHTSDMTQEVYEDIDGFTPAVDRRNAYIERIYGSIVGNDLNSTEGMRNYGKILKPKLFTDFTTTALGRFTLEEVNRLASPDEAITAAGAFLFRVRPVRGTGNRFAMAVTKEGKALVNIPASNTEDHRTSHISAEVNMAGALKMHLGSSSPDRISAHITMEGGLHLDVGRDAAGNVITTNFRGAVRQTYNGTPNEEDVALAVEVKGVKKTSCGSEKKIVEGSKDTRVNGGDALLCDRRQVNANSGYTLNCGEHNQLVSGKSQYNFALQVLENIVAGGKVSTVLAGGRIETTAAGVKQVSVAAGAYSTAVAGGAYSVTVGTGAVSVTTAAGAVTMSTASGAMAMSAGAGAVAITAGLALTLTAGAIINLMGATVILSGGLVPGVLGISRGLPMMPPGTPSLCWITALPVMGSALNLAS